MPEVTRFATIKELSSEATRVVKVTTKSGSQYTVGLVGFGAHRAVVVRGRGKDGSKIEIQDPMGALENGRSLFDVGLHEWVGQGIDVGSLSTSRIAKVEEVTDLSEVTSFSGLHRQPQATSGLRKSSDSSSDAGNAKDAAPASTPVQPESTIGKEPVPVHVFAPRPTPSTPPKASPVYNASQAELPRASTSSPDVTPVAAPARVLRRARPQPLVGSETPTADASSPDVTPVASPARVIRRARSQPLIVSETLTAPMALDPAPQPDPEPERTELEHRVLDLEYAAAYLRRIHRSDRVLERLEGYPELMDRFEAAFSLCTLTVQALSKNILDEEASSSPM